MASGDGDPMVGLAIWVVVAMEKRWSVRSQGQRMLQHQQRNDRQRTHGATCGQVHKCAVWAAIGKNGFSGGLQGVEAGGGGGGARPMPVVGLLFFTLGRLH